MPGMLTRSASICLLACVGTNEAAKFTTELSLKIQSLGLPENVNDLNAAFLEVSNQNEVGSMDAMVAKMRQAVKSRMAELHQETDKHKSAVDKSLKELESCLPEGTDLAQISSASEKVAELHKSWNRLDTLKKELSACETRAALIQQNTTWHAQKRKHVNFIQEGGLAHMQKVNQLILSGQKEREDLKAQGTEALKRGLPEVVKCEFKAGETSPEAIRARLVKFRDAFARKLQTFVCPTGAGPSYGVPYGGGYSYNAGCANAQPCCQQAAPMRRAISAQRSTCASRQMAVEQNSCGMRRARSSCANFNPCYQRRQGAFRGAVNLAMETTEAVSEKYKTLVKQQCIVNAYDEGDDESGNVASKVESCRKAEISESDLAFLKLKSDGERPRQLALLSQACSGPEEPLPGSAAFLEKYANKDGESLWEKCQASCCQSQITE
eukprot:TRINITY_DN2782_c0_g1_i1.p1 TRINITY_DN2782_c0_g1~~TRINITY_DN2782_c0_g1_i1.p1  ORF type:complete len:438 (-),score=94.35 TRINITY_DN2782_c0_g1_i1:209-1522(-)